MIPERLPSLIVLVGFWIPPAVAGWVAAALQRNTNGTRSRVTYVVLAIFVLGYAAAWFLLNLGRMPCTSPEHRPIQRLRRRGPSRVSLWWRVRWCCPAALACVLIHLTGASIWPFRPSIPLAEVTFVGKLLVKSG